MRVWHCLARTRTADDAVSTATSAEPGRSSTTDSTTDSVTTELRTFVRNHSGFRVSFAKPAASVENPPHESIRETSSAFRSQFSWLHEAERRSASFSDSDDSDS